MLNPRFPDNVLIVRYEDMLNKPRETILEVARFMSDPSAPIGDPSRDFVKHLLLNGESQLERIIASTRFNSIKKIENKEDPKDSMHKEFFRKGIAGDYKNHLSTEQIARVKDLVKHRLGAVGLGDLWDDIFN